MFNPKIEFKAANAEYNKNNDEMYITVVGFKNYFGVEPFEIGRVLKCIKEPECAYDDEAIAVTADPMGVVGYIANSAHTKAVGTFSAGRLYEKVEDIFYVRVMFITYTKVICKVLKTH